MKTRTSIVLALVALGLVLFIFGYERSCATTEEREERTERVLPDFNRDAVDRIVLGEGDERIELERVASGEADAAPVGSVGNWRVVHPMTVDADQEAVDNLLSSIDWLERRRVVEERGAVSQESFGLREPRARATIRLRGRDVTLLVGGDAPGESVYLAIAGQDDRVLVVDHEFLGDVSLEVGQVRDKRLSHIRVPAAEALRVSGRFHVVREAPMRWELQTPVEMRADTVAVENLIRELERLRATRFVADDVDDEGLGRYGLASPRREVTVRLQGEEGATTIRVGAACEGHDGELYATAYGTGTVACVPEDLLEALSVDPDSLRDLRLTRLRLSAVDGITVLRGGREVDLSRAGEGWRVGGDDGMAADSEAVEDFLDALRDGVAESVEGDLDAAGLAGDEPAADAEVRLRLVEEEGGGAEILRFEISGERVLARRGSEPVALVLPAAFAESLSVEAIGFRDRQVMDERASMADELEVVNDETDTTQLLRKPEGSWQLVEPIAARADDTVVRDVVRSLAKLRAARFVAAEPRPEHGLQRPRLRVRVRFAPSVAAEVADGGQADGGSAEARERVLLVGASSDDGAYARLDGDDATVFLIESSLVDRLAAPLVDRDLFSFSEDAVRSVVIERGAERFELARDGERWTLGGEETPSAPADRILTRLSVVRAAEAFAFGPPRPELGLDPPRARVTIRLADEDEATPDEIVVLLGAEYGEGDERRVYARREGVDATLGLPTRAAEPVLTFGANPEP